jgi:hypothetical protein
MGISCPYWQMFEECLRSSSFGGVRIGMAREQVREHLGEPDDMGGTSRKYRTPCVWKYGEIELFFSNSTHLLTTFYWECECRDSISVGEERIWSNLLNDDPSTLPEPVAQELVEALIEQARHSIETSRNRET